MDRYEEGRQKAVELVRQQNWQAALALLDRLIGERTDDPWGLLAAGTCYGAVEQYGTAIQLLSKALTLDLSTSHPRMKTDLLHNLGIQYRNLGRIEDAVACYHQELAQPNLTAADMTLIYGNLSGCFINEGNPQQCLAYADIGLRYGSSPQLHNHRGLALLELGRYREGFAAYEARYELPEFTKRDFGKAPKWDGRPVATLAIHGEQGIGDEILFLTLLPKALAICERVIVECTPRLLGLLRYSFRAHDNVVFVGNHGETLKLPGKIDAWCGMGSLPHLLWPWEPCVYLDTARAYFRGTRERIGISWRGGTTKTHEYHRNAAIAAWKPVVARLKERYDVISVQYGPAADMAKALDVPHDAANIADLHTLAGMLRSCDHVLSVCNTTIHMCGALGVPCTVLVPAKPAWRYRIEGERSDWYASVDYIRQSPGEAWERVLARAVQHIDNRIGNADHRAVQSA